MNYQMSPYSIEERIQYMKHLEHINNINTNSKLDSTKYAKECWGVLRERVAAMGGVIIWFFLILDIHSLYYIIYI